METLTPSELRNADIKSITCVESSYATVELGDGRSYEVRLRELIKDWLFLHKKLRSIKKWATGQKYRG